MDGPRPPLEKKDPGFTGGSAAAQLEEGRQRMQRLKVSSSAAGKQAAQENPASRSKPGPSRGGAKDSNPPRPTVGGTGPSQQQQGHRHPYGKRKQPLASKGKTPQQLADEEAAQMAAYALYEKNREARLRAVAEEEKARVAEERARVEKERALKVEEGRKKLDTFKTINEKRPLPPGVMGETEMRKAREKKARDDFEQKKKDDKAKRGEPSKRAKKGGNQASSSKSEKQPGRDNDHAPLPEGHHENPYWRDHTGRRPPPAGGAGGATT